MAAYKQVYARSWKQPEPYPDFMPGLIRLAAGRGWLRLGVAYKGTIPLAAQVWVVSYGKASIFKLAYDENFKSVSAGSLLTAELMRHVLDVDRVHEVDYLTGDDSYKSDWMKHRRERWGLKVFNPRSLDGLLQATRHLGGACVRRLMCSLGRGHLGSAG